jgi:hypothetical protein
MNKISRHAAILIFLCGGLPMHSGNAAQEHPKPADPATPNPKPESVKAPPAHSGKPIDALSWVVGGVWTADATKMAPGIQRIETRYQWSDNHAYIRFTTHFVLDQGVSKAYDGNFFWNPAQKSLQLWYMDGRNGITEGPVQVDGDEWTMQFHGSDFAGKMADLRVMVTRKTNDAYHWSVAEKDGDQWKELAALDYMRLAGE